MFLLFISHILEISEIRETDSQNDTESRPVFLNDHLGTGDPSDSIEKPFAVQLSVFPSKKFQNQMIRYQELITSKAVSSVIFFRICLKYCF